MADNVDNRIVNMIFNNEKFQEGVVETLAAIGQLDSAIKHIDTKNGLANLQKAIDQLTFAKMGASADAAKGKVDFSDGVESVDQLEKKSSNFTFGGILRAFASLKSKFTFGRDSQQQFSQAENASKNVKFQGANDAATRTKDNISGIGEGAQQAVGDINNAANRVSLNPIIAGTQAATAGFSVLKGAASVALGTIAAQAASTGIGLAKDLSIGPITDGFGEYATNLSSIQTILANTQMDGTGLKEVNAALLDLNHYSDQTIYNFSEMAKNIGTFTAAGVDLKTSTESIKGIANLAALSGSSSGQAASAMYQLSQAIAAGKVNLQDWNSVVNSGMGGKVFQKALFDTGKAMKTITNSPVDQTFEEWEKAGNSFRQSLSATQKKAKDGTAELAEAQKDGVKSVADAQENAAEAIENAQDRVKDAQKSVTDVAKQASQDIKNAVKDQKETFERSAENVKQAFEQVKEARKRLKEAMKPPSQDELEAATDALKTSQLDQADLATAVTDAQTEQRRAGDDLAAAQKNLFDIQRKGGSAADQKAAAEAVLDAQRAVTDAADAQERALLRQRAAARGVNEAEKELQDTRKKGKKDSEDVKNAQDDVTAALKQYRDTQVQAREDIVAAEKRVTDVRAASAERQQQAGERLADAEKAQAKTIKKSAESIAAAQEAAAKRVEAAKEQMANDKNGGQPPSWLTSDVLTTTLKQFTGDLTKAQLKAQGFNDAQIKSIQQTAKTAKKAATEVKTITQLFGVAKEAIGSGFAQSFQLLFGNFTEAKKTFTGFSTTIGTVIQRMANARNKVLSDFRDLGGRDVLISGLKNSLRAIVSLLKPVRDGFRDVFPRQTGKSLLEAATAFRDFVKQIRLGPEAADKVRRAFRGLFSIFSIAKSVLVAVGAGFKALFGELKAGDGSGGFLNLAAAIGDWLVKVDKAIKEGEGLTNFFEGLGRVIAKPIKFIAGLAQSLVNMFSGFSKDDGAEVGTTLEGVSGQVDALKDSTDKFQAGLASIKQSLRDAAENIKDAFGSIFDSIKESFSGASYDDILTGVQTGLFGGLVAILAKFLKDGINFDVGGGFFEKITDVLEGVTTQLQAMQQNVQADTLKKIAVAVALLAASLVALSLIDGKKLIKALAAIGVGMAGLVYVMTILTKLAKGDGIAKVPLLAASLVILAAAVDVLAVAVLALSQLSWEELLKGLAGVGVLMVGLTNAAIPLAKIGPGLFGTGAGLIALSVALNLMAFAVKRFGDMDVSTIAKGLVAIAAALVLMAAAMTGFPKNMVATGAGIVLVAGALNILAIAVKALGDMDISTIAKGLITMTTGLVLLAAAMAGFPPNLVATGTGLLLAATGIRILASALDVMGGMSVGEVAKSLVALGGSLYILAAALLNMEAALPGAAALVIAAGGIALLVPSLVILGKLSWKTIIKGIVGLSASLALIVTAAFALAPAMPVLLGLGAAVALIGIGVGAAAAGLGVLAGAISSLAVTGPAGLAIIVKGIESLLSILPKMAEAFIKAVVASAVALGEGAPKIATAFGNLLVAMLTTITTVAPKMGEAFGALVELFLKVIVEYVPKIVAGGLVMLLALLKGIADNIGEITKTVADIIINFLNALSEKMDGIIDAGVNLMISFIKGVVSQIFSISPAARDAVKKFLDKIGEKLKDVLKAGVDMVVNLVKGISSKIESVADAGRRAGGRLISGIASKISSIFNDGKDAIVRFVRGVAEKAEAVYNKGKEVGEKLISGIKSVANTVYTEAKKIGEQIVKGVGKGLLSLPVKLAETLAKPFTTVFGYIKKKAGIRSPSRLFAYYGEMITAGFAKGATSSTNNPMTVMESTFGSAIDSLQARLKDVPNVLDGLVETEPTITPVLDLTNVRAGAKEMGDMTNVVPITAAASYNSSAAISSEKAANDEAVAQAAAESSGGDISLTFQQENNSPKALSEGEIYRQTNNSLSRAKKMLDDLQNKKTG